MRLNALRNLLLQPRRHRLDLLLWSRKPGDDRVGPIENGNGLCTTLEIAVDIDDLILQQSIGMDANLVRGPIVDAECPRSTTDVDPQRFPRERLLKNPLPKVAGKEERRRASGTECSKKSELRYGEVLTLIDHRKVVRRVRGLSQLL